MLHLHHVDLGGAGNPPLIVLHGLLGSSRNWQTVGRDLAIRWHVLALDARNHGKSPHDPVINYSVLAGDVAQWMQAWGIRRAAIMGHSMGGKTAMVLACRHPELVEELYVVDIAPKDYQWAAHRAEFQVMNELELATLNNRAEAEERFAPLVPDLGMRKFLTTNLERTEQGGWRWIANLPVLTAALSDLEQNSLGPDDRFAGPTRFITGGRSAYVPPADHTAILQHFPAATFVTIPEAGHNPHMETRERFVRAVVAGD